MRSNPKLAVAALAGVCLMLGGRGQAAEECHARSIDTVGRCHHRGFAKRVVDSQLRGAPDEPTAPPRDVDGNLLATELAGELSTGTWFPVGGADNQWVLVVRRAEVGLPPDFAVQTWPGEGNLRFVALVQIVSKGAGAKPAVTLLAKADSLIAGTAAVPQQQPDPAAPPPLQAATVPCVDPESGQTADDANSGGYPDIAGTFRWLALTPGHRVLAAGVARSEGYAGGGGSFAGEIMLDQRGDSLVPIGCHVQSRYQMFGGDWNEDGTRQHPESQAAWVLQVQPASGAHPAEWPQLLLMPVTRNTPAARLVWNIQAGYYVGAIMAEGHRAKRPRKPRR